MFNCPPICYTRIYNISALFAQRKKNPPTDQVVNITYDEYTCVVNIPPQFDTPTCVVNVNSFI